MGGRAVPPEEPLLSTFEEGFGYITSAAVGRSLNQYQIVRKVRLFELPSVNPFSIIQLAGLGCQLLRVARTRPLGGHENLRCVENLDVASRCNNCRGHSPERDVFQKIESANPNSPGFNHYLTLQRCFIANSDASGHICFMTEPLSSSLANFRVPGQDRLPLPIVKRIIKQVLLALDYLHRECGYIHTDLNSENVLLSIPKPRASRITESIQSESALILYRFSLCESIEDISVRVMDYSEATPVDAPRREFPRQPSMIRAPEVTLRYPWTSAIDIWTVGCLLFELLTNLSLFGQDVHNYSHELHLQYMVQVLGPFPLEFLKDCEDRGKYFDEKGTLLHTTSEFQTSTLEIPLRKLQGVDESEILGTAAFLRRCLTLDPKLRPSAQDLLKDGWLS